MNSSKPILAVVALVFASFTKAETPAATTDTSKPAVDNAALVQMLSLVGPDYKKPREVSETIFNPFKIEATTEFIQQRKGAAVTEQSVAEAVGHRGVSGVVYGTDGAQSRVIIGDEVFSIGDELNFTDDKGNDRVPLVAGASVILREAKQDMLVFDFTAEGEAAKRTTYSLKNFWRP